MNELELLSRIATALENIAAAVGVDTAMRFTGSSQQHQAAAEPAKYDAAVQAIKDMPDDIPSEPEAVEPPKKEEVIAALNSYARVHGVEAGKKLIASFGVKRLDEIPVEKWAEVIAMCGALK